MRHIHTSIVSRYLATRRNNKISETWLKPYQADYIILNHNAEKDIRFYKREGGVGLYIHSSIQYKLRNDKKWH